MSEVILDYAQPLLDCAEGDDIKKRAISIAVICWNLSMFPKDTRQVEKEKILQVFQLKMLRILTIS
jgi:hypothetical protein